MSKKPRPDAKSKPVPTKRQLSRWRREERRRRIILFAGIAVIVCVVGLAGYSVYDTEIKPWHETVIRVNDTEFDMDYYVTMLRVILEEQGEPQNLYSIFPMLTDKIIDDELVRQAAPEYGISVTEEEVTQRVKEYVLTAAQGEETLDFEKAYQGQLERFGLSDDEYREIVRLSLLREKMEDYLGSNIPEVAPQVHLHLIHVALEEDAQVICQRLEDGEDFAALAIEESLDSSAESGGDIGWVPEGIMPDLDDVIFGLDVGEISQPVSPGEGQGYYILKVSEKEEAREIDTPQREILQARRSQEWIKQQRDASDIEIKLDAERYKWVEKHV